MTNRTNDKYQELRAAIGVLQEEAKRAGATNPRSAMILNLLVDYDKLRVAMSNVAALRTKYPRDPIATANEALQIADAALAA